MSLIIDHLQTRIMIRKTFLHLFIIGLLISCNQKSEQPVSNINQIQPSTLFTKLESEKTGIDFINQVTNQKDFNIFKYRNFYNGGGVAIGDINNDGLSDIYLTSNMGKNKLYLNKGNFVFEDISESSGVSGNRSWSTGVVLVDINADGLLDIYVCNAGNVKGDDQKNELFINNGPSTSSETITFTERASEYNLADSGFTTHTAFFDYDLDGDLDAYILNNSFIPVNSLGYSDKREVRSEDWNLPEMFKGGGDKLLRNDDGKFIDVSASAGIYGSLIGFGLGVTVGDINEDLFPDIYVSNDFYERDYLYINNGDGTFTEDIKNKMPHISLASMGADMADLNNDGKPEVFITDMLPEDDERLKNTSDFERYDVYKLKQRKDFYHQYMQNTLQLNNGDDTFSEVAFYSGVGNTDWSWGALLFDMDNDGYRDIYVCNGIYHDLTNQDFMDFFAAEIYQKMAISGKKTSQDSIINNMPSVPILNYAFRNNQDLTFSNATKDFGFTEPSFSNGAAYGDLDNDGDLDLVVNNVNMPLFVYQNNSENNYLKVELKGADKNTFGIGSIVEVYRDDEILRQELVPSRGFQSSIDYKMTFGLGKAEKVDSIRVVWPDGKTQKLNTINANQTIQLDITDASKSIKKTTNTENGYFSEIKTNMLRHKEDPYVDFDYEGLIPKMLSKEGPAIAVGDVNGDKRDDVYVGGAANQPGNLYIQTKDNQFFKSAQKTVPWKDKEEISYEDTAAHFIDIDNDQDLDLVIGSGGNFAQAKTTQFSTRIYLNDGKGNFSKRQTIFNDTNTSVIAPHDFDGDGDVDIFIGSISVPGIYGINPKNQLLENDGKGNFKNSIESKAFKAQDIGMITDATWEDVDGDNKKDLILVGEWMSPKIFKNNGRRLTLLHSNLDSVSGWFNTVKATDLDEDGDIDLILGNRGLNAMYKANNQQPAKVYINDFDNNGTIEQVFTQTINGKDVPIHLKKEITGQINVLKKQNLKFSEYATKSIDELFSAEVLQNAIVKNVNNFASLVAYNDGNGNFEIKALPREAQLSCVNAIETVDLNNDGHLDLILGGNNYNFKPQFSRLDASRGVVLFSDGKGKYIHEESSGFFVEGEVKEIHWIKNNEDRKYLISGINNQPPKIFELKE
ncbi:VCBS repeat-containing protein [Aquimarina algiphila]|uniref:VCBS repeat-containing protein n=2 Tax=Aquimarina algiphila TaxID=2047982 RepID=UPI0024922E04|nr:VCBS repeat-containing protein [Aquimarina algiphila]